MYEVLAEPSSPQLPYADKTGKTFCCAAPFCKGINCYPYLQDTPSEPEAVNWERDDDRLGRSESCQRHQLYS